MLQNISSLKARLLSEKELVESELSSFASKDPIVEGDWDIKFPSFGDERTEQDENTSEVEQYTNQLPQEYALETRLQNINLALKKIDQNNYGLCEACNNPIEQERLEIEPAARTHVSCK